jgi:light-regulated signal transduction histidine kinase (bacteriophytochrome)
MTRLIDAMLDLSRLSGGELKRVPVDLSVLAKDVADDLKRTQPERAVEFVIPNGLTVEGDAVMLRVVVENLLGNAWKFTGKRDAAKIEFGAVRRNGSCAYFVRDNGAGFDMAYAGRLFCAFQRFHAAADYPGSGIGLATVQRIVHRHGGKVWAEGEPEKGATFFFTLV